MPPLAGRPPFATDEPDSFYESGPAPQRRVRQPAPPNPNDRTSAYNVYENYLGADDSHAGPASNRQSGVGALGMGLMNMSDSDDSDDEEPVRRPSPSQPKNAALAAATVPRSAPKPAVNSDPEPVQAPIIVAPRPGYAAPIAALNLARPENVTTRAPPPPPQPVGVPSLENPFEPPTARVYNPRGALLPNSPSPSGPPSTPHPLQPPITPITPVFAKPGGVTFSEPIPRSKPIMRSGTEDALPTRRGERGDDFWRRFSMVAKIENASGAKESRWLKKTQSGSSRLSRWVWVVAIVLVLCIVAACIIGWKVSKNKPNDSPPTAFGGQANERPTSSSAVPDAAGSSTVKHVSPTHTVARREYIGPAATRIPLGHTRALERRKRLFDSAIAH